MFQRFAISDKGVVHIVFGEDVGQLMHPEVSKREISNLLYIIEIGQDNLCSSFLVLKFSF